MGHGREAHIIQGADGPWKENLVFKIHVSRGGGGGDEVANNAVSCLF